MKYFNSILKIGLSKSMDTLLYWRVLLLNGIISVCVALSFVLLFINAFHGLYFHATISIVSTVLLLLVFLMHWREKYLIGSFYFINLSTLLIFIASLAAFTQHRFTETENLFYFLFVMTLFLLEGRKAQVQFFILVSLFLVLKFSKNYYQGLPYDENFSLTLVNSGVLIITLYAFSSIFTRFLKKSLKETQKQQSILYTLIDNIPLYVGIYNKKGRYTMVNRNYEDVFFMKREEIIGKRLRDIIPEKNIEIYEPMLKRALKGEEVEFHEKTKMKDGSTITANGKYIPVFDKNGKVESVTVSLNDITKMETIRQELESANQAKDRLLSIVSHDIKGPLNNFESLLKVSRKKIINQDEFAQFANTLQAQFDPIQQTVNDLLDWSRMQLKDTRPKPVHLNPISILDDILNALQVNIDGKSIELSINGSLESLYADQDHFKIITRNILQNAIKFTPENGKIGIEYFESDAHAVIRISDSGEGMSQTLIDQVLSGKIIDSSPGTKGEKGVGLGLNVCLELIRKNHGEVKIERLNPLGTLFTLKFPTTG